MKLRDDLHATMREMAWRDEEVKTLQAPGQHPETLGTEPGCGLIDANTGD